MALKLPLTTTMQTTTHRQFVVWQAWFALEWNSPNRSDHYLMQVAAEVRRGYAKHPRQVKDSDFQIEFTEGTGKTISPEVANQRAKAAWIGRMTGVVRKVKGRPSEPEADERGMK